MFYLFLYPSLARTSVVKLSKMVEATLVQKFLTSTLYVGFEISGKWNTTDQKSNVSNNLNYKAPFLYKIVSHF